VNIRCLFGHKWGKWTLTDTIRFYSGYSDPAGYPIKIVAHYTATCEKCGTLGHKKVTM